MSRTTRPVIIRVTPATGPRAKTVLTEVGPVQVDVPRDRAGTFEPVIVPKGKRRLEGVDRIVLSLTARGLTTGEISAHFAGVYGASIGTDTISRISDRVTEDMTEWLHRPLDEVYPVVFIDAIVVKVRDGQVTNKPFYVAIGVTVHGERDILGIWAGDGGEGAKFWLNVLTEITNRGVTDVLMLVCDGFNAAVGSSRMIMVVASEAARTISTRCFWATVRSSTRGWRACLMRSTRCGTRPWSKPV